MNKQTEALKMAIEALESAYGVLECEGMIPIGYESAIQACKEALAQPAKNIRDSFNEMLEDKVSYYKNKQSAQKPVAKGFIRSLVSIDKNGIETWKEEPFYTSAPSWQGLSDDEIDDVWFEVVKENNFEGTGKYFARAIEQALKEKNT